VKKIDRTSKGLRDALFDEIDSLRSDSPQPTKSMAVAKMAGQIINIAAAEMESSRATEKHEERAPWTDLMGTGKRTVIGKSESAPSEPADDAASASAPATGL